MYIKCIVSYLFPLIYVLLRNHVNMKSLDEKNYQLTLQDITIIHPSSLFIIVVGLHFFTSDILMMNLWIVYYMILSLILLKKGFGKETIKQVEKYFSRIWRMDIIYLLLFSYIIVLFQEENVIYYYLIIGLFIYFVDILTLFINSMMLKIEYYKNRSEIYEN